MRITSITKNGQALMVYKGWDELTDLEKQEIVFPATTNRNDYENYQLRFNKKGELLGIAPHGFVKEIDRSNDLLDGLTVLYADKHSKIYKSARKHIKVSDKQIDEARKYVKNRKA